MTVFRWVVLAMFGTPFLVCFICGLVFGFEYEVAVTEVGNYTPIKEVLPYLIGWALLGVVLLVADTRKPKRGSRREQ